MALRVKTDLWCDICGSYPTKAKPHHPSNTFYTELYVNASGTLVLPEGWCTGPWESTTTFCSVTCQAREAELEERRQRKKHRGLGGGDEKCSFCGKVQLRLGCQDRYLLPPGWGIVGRYYTLCAACYPNETIRARYPVRSNEDD